MFANASKVGANDQLGVLIGLVLEELANELIFYSVTWFSHKAKRPGKVVPATEILACSRTIDESKAIARTHSEILRIDERVHLCVDSKGSFTSLLTQHSSIRKLNWGDLAIVRFNFKITFVDRTTWIASRINLADPLTKNTLLMHCS